MPNIHHIIAHAESHCTAQGVKLTSKRKQVLSALLASNKALSAYELIDHYRERSGNAMPATSMYRILDFLESESLIHRLNIANKYVACAHIACEHKHAVPQFLICQRCQHVEEISVDQSTIDDLKINVENAKYHLLSPQLEMSCLCQNCYHNA